MISKAKATYVRMSPRKIRYVLDLVRRKRVNQAYSILDRTTRRASSVVKKLVQTAADAAVKNKQENIEDLYISKITADGAGMMKRFRAMSLGRAGVIRKRLSHIYVELERVKGSPEPSVQTPVASKAKKEKTAGAK